MNWQLFLSIYFIFFIDELLDKTVFAALLLATRTSGLAVFTGMKRPSPKNCDDHFRIEFLTSYKS